MHLQFRTHTCLKRGGLDRNLKMCLIFQVTTTIFIVAQLQVITLRCVLNKVETNLI